MDKRTSEGKKFHSLNSEEKQLYLLEQIFQRLGDNTTNDILRRTNRILLHIAKTQVKLMQVQNTSSHWTTEYIKELLKEVDTL